MFEIGLPHAIVLTTRRAVSFARQAVGFRVPKIDSAGSMCLYA